MIKCYACAERETCYVGLNGGCTKCRCFSPDPYRKAELKAKVRTKLYDTIEDGAAYIGYPEVKKILASIIEQIERDIITTEKEK